MRNVTLFCGSIGCSRDSERRKMLICQSGLSSNVTIPENVPMLLLPNCSVVT